MVRWLITPPTSARVYGGDVHYIYIPLGSGAEPQKLSNFISLKSLNHFSLVVLPDDLYFNFDFDKLINL